MRQGPFPRAAKLRLCRLFVSRLLDQCDRLLPIDRKHTAGRDSASTQCAQQRGETIGNIEANASRDKLTHGEPETIFGVKRLLLGIPNLDGLAG